MNLVIGSGDTRTLLSGRHTKGFAGLLQKFVSNDKPYYNAFASPINALRTGAILEKSYLKILPDNYYIQFEAKSKEIDCLISSIDFAIIENGKIVDFDELKTIWFTEYIDVITPLIDNKDYESIIKKKFKANYNQVQFQLYCSGLDSANLVFLSAESYNDEENYLREIKKSDYVKFRIHRDDEVISKIKERAKIFQDIKDFVNN